MSISDDNLDPSPITSKTLTTLAGGKRKREYAANAAADIVNNGDQVGTHPEQLHQLFKDTIELLKRCVINSMNIQFEICLGIANKACG